MTAPLSVHRRAGIGRPVVFLHGFASRGIHDWPDSEWGSVLADRPSLVIDLPAHGDSPALGTARTSVVLDVLADAVGSAPVDLVGYSLGARLAWDLTGHPAMDVHRLVLGGLSAGEPFGSVDLTAARSTLTGGPDPADPLTSMILQMVSLPDNRPGELLDLIEGMAAEPFTPDRAAPQMPVLLVGGVDDGMTAGMESLAALLSDGRVLRVPGDHHAALHSPQFREAVAHFLAG